MNRNFEKRTSASPTPETWLSIIQDAYALFDDLKERGFDDPPFSLGGGTILMLNYKHRLSKDIDFFAYDVQWIGLLSPRLNAKAAALSTGYIEQANSVKIATPTGDIDFVIASDITEFERTSQRIAGRTIAVDPPSEILAKKLFYRAAQFQPRDVYDMSAVIDLAPAAAAKAAKAAKSKRITLLRRLDELMESGEKALLQDIVPYDGPLRHTENMISKVKAFLIKEMEGPGPADKFEKGAKGVAKPKRNPEVER